MNISPISAISTNQMHFEGGKKQKNTHAVPHSTNALMAIPLATLIAMSPLNVNGETGEVNPAENPVELIIKKDKTSHLIKTEKYKGNDGVTRRLYYVGDKEKSKNVKDIYINDGELEGKRIVEYKNITLKLVGDDGVQGKEFTFPQLTVQSTEEGDKFGYTERNISDNLAKFLLTKENKTDIATKNITRKVNACQYGLKDAEISNTLWTKAKSPKIVGEKIASAKRKIGNDVYTISAYNTNQDKNSYEIVTIKRNDDAEFRLAGLKNVTSTLIDCGETIGDFKYKQISLIKGKNLEVARIFNDELFDELAKLTKDSKNKAFKMEDIHETQIVDHKGYIYDVE